MITKTTILRATALPFALAGSLFLAGCASGPYGGGGGGYGTSYGNNGGYSSGRCAQCGTVESVQQVYVSGKSSSTLGTVIGAVVGGVLGNTVGKGDGRKAATVAGAVAGGAVGHEVGQRNGGQELAYRVTVRLQDGRMATVTQREDPRVRTGDYVEIRNDHVYPR